MDDRTDWSRQVADLWASFDVLPASDFLAAMVELVALAPPDDPVAAFEHASALDATDHPDLAEPLYRRALDLGLDRSRRRQAVIQLASTLRVLGRASESVDLLTIELQSGSDDLDDAVRAFLALALVDAGREREATAIALAALARHLPKYRRSVREYAQAIADSQPGAGTS